MNGDQSTQPTSVSPPSAVVPDQSTQPAPPAGNNFFHADESGQSADDEPLFIPPPSPSSDASTSSPIFDKDEVADSLSHTEEKHNEVSLSWSAATSIIGHKPKVWLFMLVAGSVIVAGGVYLLNKDIISSVAIVLASVLFGAYSTKKPQAIQYLLDSGGITVGMKHYIFAQFRSFSIVDEGAYLSIALAPLQRFSPTLSISYDPQLHNQIIDILSSHLPLEDHKKDAIDQITSRIKF